MGQVMYKLIVAKSELWTESELQNKNLGWPANFFFYNSHLAAIHLYVIRPYIHKLAIVITKIVCLPTYLNA